MKLKEIVNKLGLEILTAESELEVEISDGYTSDLLSDVIAHAQERNLWVTLQTHPNIVAVAKLKDLAGIILVHGRQPEKETKKKAQEEKIPLLGTAENAFIISGQLYALLRKKE